jgi:tryptophan 2,3-dioxygenase
MAFASFYSSNYAEYFWQKPHYDLANKVLHSSVYKTMNPLRTYNDFHPERMVAMPTFFGQYPQMSWLYGNLDYSFKKFHRHYQSHDEWYPDRKNKSLGFKQGGFCDRSLRNPKYLTLKRDNAPRGCAKEVRKYEMCKAANGSDKCFNDKISIMEVCPDHVLAGFREKKKWFLRAKAIDNQTYRRAMTVSDFNKGNRSVSDLTLKDWSYGSSKKMRPDSYWYDDRYDPVEHRHPHRHDTVNFPDAEYKDVFGGNWGQKQLDDKKKHALNFWSGKSKAMIEVDGKFT